MNYQSVEFVFVVSDLFCIPFGAWFIYRISLFGIKMMEKEGLLEGVPHRFRFLYWTLCASWGLFMLFELILDFSSNLNRLLG